MDLPDYFPIFHQLTLQEQEQLLRVAVSRRIPQGTLFHNGDSDCMGLVVVHSGQLRVFITSDEGREITLYRLFERDICLLSASCIINSIQFEISITAEKETKVWVIPSDFYKALMKKSAVTANYTNELMAARFTDVMWLMEQAMWKSFDKRLAHFLLEEKTIEKADTLKITHEIIAGHLGTAREVVTRMLKYFQTEGMVKLARGTIEIVDSKKLEELSGTLPSDYFSIPHGYADSQIIRSEEAME